MKSPVTDHLTALLLLAALAGCSEAPAGETAVPGASVARERGAAEPVQLIAPFEQAAAQPEEEWPEPEAEQRLVSAQPSASRPTGPSWTPPAYVPPQNVQANGRPGGSRAGRRGGAGNGGTAPASSAPAQGREHGTTSGEVNQGPTGGKRSMKDNPALTSTEVPRQKAKKKYATPYQGRKVRNPSNQGGGQ